MIHYDVQLSEPYTTVDSKTTYRRNYQLDILTTNVARAVELALIEHPQGEVHQVLRRNTSHFIIDPALTGVTNGA